MKLFLDTNVVLDLVRYREPFVYDVIPIFQQGKMGIHQLLISDLTFANVAYIAKKSISLVQLYELLLDLRSNVHVVMIGEECVDSALQLKANDFEDALQYFSAKQGNADFIITRNKADFYFSDIPVMEPKEFLLQ